MRCALVAGAIGVGGSLAISALGFGAGGINAGVPPGGLVAILQSLDTKGLTAFARTPAGELLIATGCLVAL